MNSLYTLALRQTSAIQADLSALEQSYGTAPSIAGPSASSSSSTSALNGQITASLAALDRTIEDYDSMARREIVDAKREKALGRVARFRDDYASLRKQYDKAKTNGVALKAALDREALLSGSTTSAVASPYAGVSSSSNRRPAGTTTMPLTDSPFTINMPSSSSSGPILPTSNRYKQNSPPLMSSDDFGNSIHNNARTNYALRESDFMSSTAATLDSYIQQGQAVLGNLGTQRDMLKGTKRRLLSAANTLGLSRTTIQYIERRTKGDFYILIGGGSFTIFCFYLILKYFG